MDIKSVFAFIILVTAIIIPVYIFFDSVEKKEVKILSFKMDKYEVTVKDFRKCVAAEVCLKKVKGRKKTVTVFFSVIDNSECNYDNSEKENHPMNCLTYSAAEKYCNWLKKRLPTEEEWEYAAKSNQGYENKGFVYSGSDKIDEIAWYKDNSNNSTHSVGLKNPNSFGLYDMTGNVWEWVENGKNLTKNLRGGAYNTSSYDSKISSRSSETLKESNIGFRCVK